MLHFILLRLAMAIPTLLGMSFIAFLIVALAPGDPVMMELRAMGIVPEPDDIAALQAEFGLDKPLMMRYAEWLWRALQLEFGTSIATGRPVMAEIAIYLPATLSLAISALLGAIVISLTLGGLAATAGHIAGAGLRGLTILLVSVPSFWLALLLIYVFVLHLGWARLVGDGSLPDLVLPAITLSLAAGAALGRMVYERIRSEMSEDHIRLAIAKGLGPMQILLGHIAPRIIGPLATAWANAFGGLLGGAVVVESIFGWPGLGQLILQAIAHRRQTPRWSFAWIGAACRFRATGPVTFPVRFASPRRDGSARPSQFPYRDASAGHRPFGPGLVGPSDRRSAGLARGCACSDGSDPCGFTALGGGVRSGRR
ncbi:ABC transporter permease [Shimia litoralis]|uniref:ABC transporter permease n=1 Tax=Shimia litoralis TaxID=420403 RepID=A0A4U7N1K2_9RHOB|nr:ABC transporter permease [Shimia litoralis]TKZ19378.1 ABC transporter permease [Shimia litoralis]